MSLSTEGIDEDYTLKSYSLFQENLVVYFLESTQVFLTQQELRKNIHLEDKNEKLSCLGRSELARITRPDVFGTSESSYWFF